MKKRRRKTNYTFISTSTDWFLIKSSEAISGYKLYSFPQSVAKNRVQCFIIQHKSDISHEPKDPAGRALGSDYVKAKKKK